MEEGGIAVGCCPRRRGRRVAPIVPQAPQDSPSRAQSASKLWSKWKQPPVALHREFQFSWTQSLTAVVIYALLLTDVWRTGLGVSQVSSRYWTLEPDLFVVAGPWELDMGLITAVSDDSKASEKRVPLWDYKSDTTSFGMRAVATFLQLHAWPQWVFQWELQCPDDPESLSKATMFGMLDALVDDVRQHNSFSMFTRRPYTHSHGSESAITLRDESVWRDRVHDYILPEVFANTVKGATQALYYSSSASIGSGMCSRTKSAPQLYLCSSLVANYRRLAKVNQHVHKLMVTVFTERIAELQASYPAAHVDFLLIEVREDASKGDLTFQGRRIVGTVLIARVRNCNSIDSNTGRPSQCTTAFIDEHRFDGVLGASNAAQWYPLVTLLRATCADPLLGKVSRVTRWRLTLKAFVVVSSHVVAYSNLFSIACYAAAHIIDSSMSYEILAQTFNTPSEVLNTSLINFFLLSSVQMRNIWLLALALHLRALVFTRRCWAPSSGMVGIAEFVISGTSALTIFAQFRRLEFRDTSILSVQEIPYSPRMSAVKVFRYPTMSSIESIVKGTIIDFKCLGASLLVVCGSAILLDRFLRLCSTGLHQRFHPLLQLWTRSWLPNSAEYVWSARAQIVTWHDANRVKLHRSPRVVPLGNGRPTVRVVVASKVPPTPGKGHEPRHRSPRRDHLDPLVYLTNIVMMSDPITFARLRWMGSGVPLCFFRCKQSSRTLLVPLALVESEQNVEVDWEEDWTLLTLTDSRQLPRSELLRCGGRMSGVMVIVVFRWTIFGDDWQN